MVLTEMPHHSKEEEERMAQILQILTVHAQLRASPSSPPGRVDEVGPGSSAPPRLEGVGEAGASDASRPMNNSGGEVMQHIHIPIAAAIGEEGPNVLFSAVVKTSQKLMGLLCLIVSDPKKLKDFVLIYCSVSNSEDSDDHSLPLTCL